MSSDQQDSCQRIIKSWSTRCYLAALLAVANQLTTPIANRLTFACSCLSAGACASGDSCNATSLSQRSCRAGEYHPHSRHKQQQARGQAAFGPSYTLEHCTHASCGCVCGCKEERAAGAQLVSPDALTRYHLDTHAMQSAHKLRHSLTHYQHKGKTLFICTWLTPIAN